MTGFQTAGVVHDLRNLIQIATAAINIVQRTPDMPAVHAGPMLARARASLEQAGAIARQTIAGIRDQTSGPRHASLPAAFAGIEAMVETMGEGLELDIILEPGLPVVTCDAIGLQSALLNLVFNARDAMAGNGVITIEGRRHPTVVEIRVVDSGIGMSETTMARAFDPFFTTKSDGLGGVGLPMVDRFVREAGGDVSIESALGLGTTVILRLPIARNIQLQGEA